MGDGADMLIEQIEHELYCDEISYYDEEYEPSFSKKPKILKCKFCKKENLHWEQIQGKWIMFECDNTLHSCKDYNVPIEILKEIAANKLKKNKNVMNQLLPIPSWDELFFLDVYRYARKSKDPRTKIGAVIVKWDEKDPISHGYNGFPRKVNDNDPLRWERPEKYFYIEHGEKNAILNCARTGRATLGTTMFTQGIPCADCTKAVIQAGVNEIVVHKQWQEFEQKFNWEKWNDSSIRSQIMLEEAKVKIRVFDKLLGVQGVLDGKIIDV